MSSSASSSITSTMSSKVMHADQPVVVVDHRRRDEVVALEQARDFLLVVGGAHRMQVLLDQIGDRHRPLGAQQPVERHHALEPAAGVDDVELPEAVRQIGRFAHVVDGLADRPVAARRR